MRWEGGRVVWFFSKGEIEDSGGERGRETALDERKAAPPTPVVLKVGALGQQLATIIIWELVTNENSSPHPN